MKPYEPILSAVQSFNASRTSKKDLDICGPIAEIIAEEELGVVLYENPDAEGADGKEGDNHIEIKSISARKGKDYVRVKRSGHWNILIVVKFNDPKNPSDFEIRWKRRKDLSAFWPILKVGTARVSWSKLNKINLPSIPPW